MSTRSCTPTQLISGGPAQTQSPLPNETANMGTLPRPHFPPSPTKPSRHAEVLQSFCDKFPEVSPAMAIVMLKTIYRAQEKLGFKETEMVNPTDSFPHYIAIERNSFHVLTGVAGQGGNGRVSFGPFFPITRIQFSNGVQASPSKPPTYARKERLQRTLLGPGFSPIKEKTDRYAEEMSPNKRKYMGRILRTSKSRGRAMALMPYHPKNFKEIDWANLPKPGQYLVYKLGLTLKLLQGLHQASPPKVHRDFKAENVMDTENPDIVKVIDLDGARDAFFTPGGTNGTPTHLNPSSFGSYEETLINQKALTGCQRPCDDMYAYGVTGINLIMLLGSNLIPDREVAVHQAIKGLEYKTLTPEGSALTFTEGELRTYGKAHPYRAFFMHKPWTSTLAPERIGVYPDLKTYTANLNVIIRNLPLPESEKSLLSSFAVLCLKLRNLSDQKRPDAATTHVSISEMLATLKESESESAHAASAQEKSPKKKKVS